MQKPTINLSRKEATVQVPYFLLDYTADLTLFLALKRSFTEMFTFWVQSEDYKSKVENNDYTPEIHFYVQELFDSIHLAQQGGNVDIKLSVNNN
jgi:hypothetical protein